MQQETPTFQALGINIVLVTFEQSALARAYLEEVGVDWPMLTDETRGLYHAYGMLKGALWDLLGPAVWWAYTKELFRGRMPRLAHLRKDTSQLGGNVLIDPSGIARFVHVARGAADRPAVATLLAARRDS